MSNRFCEGCRRPLGELWPGIFCVLCDSKNLARAESPTNEMEKLQAFWDERALEAAARAYLRSNTDCYGEKDIECEMPHIRAAIAAYLEASGEARDAELGREVRKHQQRVAEMFDPRVSVGIGPEGRVMSDKASEMHNAIILNAHIDALQAQIAALTAKLEGVRKLVKQIEKNSPDAWARMKAEQILRKMGHVENSFSKTEVD